MPSSQTNLRRLDRQIRQLEEMDQLSDYNTRHKAFLELWRQFGLKDVVLVIQPKGKINRGETPKPKLVEVTDMAAADLLAYAPQQGLRVRVATEEEVRAYREYHEAKRRHAAQENAARVAEAARAQMAAMQGMVAAATGPVIVAPDPPPPPDVTIGEYRVEDDGPLVPEIPPIDAPPTGGTAPQPEVGNEAVGAPVPLLAELGDERLVRALVESGFSSVAAVAAADPTDLAEKVRASGVKGFGTARAAEIVTKAAEVIAASESKAE